MTIKQIFFSLFLSLLYFETSYGNYFNGDGYLNDDLTQMNNRFRRSVDEILLQHPLRFKSRYEDRKYLLKPPMHVRRTLPFQLVTQPKTSSFLSNTEGRSFPIHFPSMDGPYQRARNLIKMGGGISDLTKDNTLDDFTIRLQEKEKNEEGLPPMPTSSAVTFKNNLTPSDLLSMLRGYSSEMNDENQKNRMRFGLF